MGRGEAGDFFADAGAVVAGSAALWTVAGFVLGSVAQEFDPKHDPDAWARRCGLFGGVVGLVLFINGL